MSSNKKKLIMNTVSVSLGCSSCRKSKLTSFFNPKPKLKLKLKPKPKPKSHSLHNYYSSSSSTKKTTTHCSLSEYETGTSFSPSTDTAMYWDMDMDNDQDSTKCSMATVRGFGHLGGESLAVEKDSDDPYLDFRQSMLQMILEKEIYSKDDLKELLNCFLQLNSPYHHGIIVRAFTEIWNGVFSVKPGSGSGSGAAASPKLRFGFRPGDF
ncbi:Transcription repressor OFP8 [Hibiscus syriacus]|uniref:Transcription repressor n=1 Tax=Hibiscus syriacus TaxID=106335 RepID=A0A6A3CBU5_HIBSY|nr:transcription repressor OFP6-like [Hibiscus syriacus]KAE8726650.1 Transcription repressor OFP8 [Hibiscus syriacus]